jgi:hypothetical protein
MKRAYLFCLVLVLVGAAGAPAQSPEFPIATLPYADGALAVPPQGLESGPGAVQFPDVGSGGAALSILEGYIQRSWPPLEPADRGTDFLRFLGWSVLSAGCAGLALIPTIENWSPEESEGDYALEAALWGSLQGAFLTAPVGTGLAHVLVPAPDLRADYGSLLDAPEGEREQRAYLILRARAVRARRRRELGAFLTILATAIPAGAYYLGEAIVGPNPNVREFGVGYVAGIAVGSLLSASVVLIMESPDEADFAGVEREGYPGGEQ